MQMRVMKNIKGKGAWCTVWCMTGVSCSVIGNALGGI